MKRTSEQLQQAQDITSQYLQESKNDPHKAYDLYIKDHLLSGKSFPSCIEGIKDFITASKPAQEQKKAKRYTPKKRIIIDPRMENADFNKGIEALLSRINIINEEIKVGKLQNDNMSYICNSFVAYFNNGCSILEAMNILPKTSDNLTCIEYTKERIKIIQGIKI
jgi:esterase/lipase